jgi:cytochrome P450
LAVASIPIVLDPDPGHDEALAKLELEIAFGTLLRRIPRLELIEAPRWKPTFVLRGLEGLRVRV